LVVPVGEDQVSHVEFGREIVRRFNFYYGANFRPELSEEEKRRAFEIVVRHLPPGSYSSSAILLTHARSELGLERFHETVRKHPEYFTSPDTLREPEAMLTRTPRIPGTDGRKMSKSYGNFISLSESDESIRAKTKVMMTDPARKRRQDPGNPEVCPVFDWHKLFSPPETQAWSAHGCRTAGIGCIECKAAMADHLIRWIQPIRQRREDYQQDQRHVRDILNTGSKRARMVAQRTMERVREAIFGSEEMRAGLAPAAAPAKNVKAGD
jgi:tryptophanyl-tRNA synthetase